MVVYHYIALSDSITYGYGASTLMCAYPSLVVDRLASYKLPVRGSVIAEPGWSSQSLLRAIACNLPALAQATSISIFIGGDDLIYAGLLEAKTRNMDIIKKALSQYHLDLNNMIRLLKQRTKAKILICTQYNPFPNSSFASAAISMLNSITATTAFGHGIKLVPIHARFTGREPALIANYTNGTLESALHTPVPIHSNNRGHQVIASALVPFLRYNLA